MKPIIANLPRRSLQPDANFGFLLGIDPWPRYWEDQDKLLASGQLTPEQKQRLQDWIDTSDQPGRTS